MSNMIKALKENKKPFGLMAEEMQAKAEKIGWIEFDCYNGHTPVTVVEGSGEDIEWEPAGDNNETGIFVGYSTYRLRPDYKAKPSVVERRIYPNDSELCFDDGGEPTSIHIAISSTHFIGFKYEDGSRMPFPICYGIKGRLGYGIIADVDALDEEPVVYHATHVLFEVKP